MPKLISLIFATFLLSGCGLWLGVNRPLSLEDRLKAFSEYKSWNLNQDVQISWTADGVPYIFAKTDEDLFYATGVVQAFLRQTQLELFRRLSQGRMAELAGEKAYEADEFIRTIDFGKVHKEIERGWSAETKMVASSFIKGINDFVAGQKKLPIDLRILGFTELEPWTIEDLIRVHRFTSADVNWVVWPKYIKLLSDPNFDKFWNEWGLPETGGNQGTLSLLEGGMFNFLSDIGSNAFVVSSSRMATGKPLVAGDPHLGLMIPNLWFFIGQYSPRFQTLGMAMPTFPVPVMGRNRNLAWTGTNLWGVSTHLFRAGSKDLDAARVRKEQIKVRWEGTRTLKIKDTDRGPIISNTKLFRHEEPLIMSWAGHQVSDELGSFIRANRARNTDDFFKAFTGFGVSAMNFVAADKSNGLIKIHVMKQPILKKDRVKALVKPSDDYIVDYRHVQNFPVTRNPKEGFIVSSNDKVEGVATDLGWFYAPKHRKERIEKLLTTPQKLELQQIRNIQTDTYLYTSEKIMKFLKTAYGELQLKTPAAFDFFGDWNFFYETDLYEPHVFEELVSYFAKEVFAAHGLIPDQVNVVMGHLSWKDKLIPAYKKLDEKTKKQILRSLAYFSPRALARKRNWGSVHKLKLTHPLEKVPLIGRYFVFYEGPYPGGNGTVFKALHSSTNGKYDVLFGANSRVIFDFSGEDSNWGVLLGGQDGYLWAENTSDQIPLWMNKKYIDLPFSPKGVKEKEKFQTTLKAPVY